MRYNRPMSVFGNVAKWLGAPLGCAAIGYFIIGPRLSHRAGQPVPKPTQQVAQVVPQTEEAGTEVVAKKPTKVKTPQSEAPVATDSPAEETRPRESHTVDTSEKPVLEVTTETAKPISAQPVHKPRKKKRKPKPAPGATTDPASNADPASSAAPATTSDSPKVTEPAATPGN